MILTGVLNTDLYISIGIYWAPYVSNNLDFLNKHQISSKIVLYGVLQTDLSYQEERFGRTCLKRL